MILIYLLVVCYSFFCAPNMFFKLFKYSDTPEYNFFYLLFCIVIGITLLPIVFRILTKIGIINE